MALRRRPSNRHARRLARPTAPVQGRRQKPEAPPIATEFRLACAVADTLRRCARKDWQWTAFPAGEHREVITGERLKRMGLKPGWPDYIFISPGGVAHFLELKRKARGSNLTDAQAKFRDWCLAQSVPHAVARTYDEAIAIVTEWDVMRLEVRPQ